MTIVFEFLSGYFGKSAELWGHLATGLIGVVAGFLFVALSPPLTDRRLGVLATCSIGFAFFFWAASFSLPDLWLAQIIAGLGTGILTAAAYRWGFLEPPIIPRVP
ncbi:MAG TPA: hypothetical protein VGC14_19705 [Rhizobium sp.]